MPHIGHYMATTTQIPHDVDPLRGFGDSTNARSLKDVTFTKQQLAYLETVFPERCIGINETDAQLRLYAGQRSVILHIRSRT